jgi:hypothetical protein
VPWPNFSGATLLALPVQRPYVSVGRASPGHFRGDLRTLFAKLAVVDPKWHPVRSSDPFLIQVPAPSGAKESLHNTQSKEVQFT